MAKKGFGTGTCVYCGRNDVPTIGEHIFGRQLFLIRHRNRLPKVPCCEECNTAKSQLENYVMAAVPLGANHASAREYAEANVERRLAGNKPLRTSIVESLQRGKSGLFAYAVDSAKVLELMRLTTKGLFAYHFRQPLHQNWEPRIRHVTVGHEKEGIAALLNMLGSDCDYVHRNLGEGTVEYWGQRSRGLPYFSGWRFILFGGLSWTGNPEAPDEVYETILCGTFRKPELPFPLQPDERAISTALRPDTEPSDL